MPDFQVRRTRNELVISGCGSLDPYLLTRLLRHRPPSVLPFSLVTADGCATFYFDLHGFESLGRYVYAKGKQASGKALLNALLSAVREAESALLWPHPDLLVPGLVFLDSRHSVRIIALPLPVQMKPGALMTLFDALLPTDDFSPEMQAKLSSLLQANDYEQAASLIASPPPADMVRHGISALIRTRLLAWQDKIRVKTAALFRGSRELDITAPLDDVAAMPIGIISEGLPGTKDEELGEKAFILVDEFLLGRDSRKVDFFLDDERCGRIHARILRRRGLFFLEDLGSKNGTVLDGHRLAKYREVILPDQAKLQFGNLVYFFTREI